MSRNETIHTSSTGGQKAGNHTRVGLIPTDELLEVAELYGKGAAKYSDGNWRKGYPWHLSFDALCRHLFAWWGGEEFDNGEGGTGQEHLDAVVFHALALKWFRKHRPQFDDRPHAVDAEAARETDALYECTQRTCDCREDPRYAPRAPRMVDSLGDNERDAQWTSRLGRYRWDTKRYHWMRLPETNPDVGWIPTSCCGRIHGPFTEVLALDNPPSGNT